MRKKEIMEFFDSRAAEWDKEMVKSDEIINRILDNVGVHVGDRVLDVACGTGVLIPYYLERQAASVTAVDISTEMIKRAEAKFPQQTVRFFCGDAETMQFDQMFDCIVIYNAFPHFPNPEGLIRRLSAFLKQGGRLTVAHGMSRAEIDRRHRESASRVSVGLMHEDALAEVFKRNLQLTTKISDDRMYQITGIKL